MVDKLQLRTPSEGGGFGDIMQALGANHPAINNVMARVEGMTAPMAALGGQPDFRQAIFDWRQDRPDRQGIEKAAFRQALTDWRMARPGRGGQPMPGPGNNNGNGPPQGFPTPVLPPQAVGPNNIPGMAGNSLYVQGMTPGSTAYDLPTY